MYRKGDKIGQFELIESLGHGTFGEVWKACSSSSGDGLQEVAIKIATDADFAASLKNHPANTGDLDHENIVDTFEMSIDGPHPYVVMELLQGPTLSEYLRKKGYLNWKEAASILIDILSALEFAHREGILHRDLKPENIILHRGNRDKDTSEKQNELPGLDPSQYRVKVTDFDTGRQEETVKSKLLVSAQGQTSPEFLTRGTFDYMAPEQKRGKPSGAPTADLYSCGVILYELLTGTLPRGAFPEPDRKNDTVPGEGCAIIWKSLQTEPEERYQKAEEMKNDLEKVLEGKTPRVFDDYQGRRSTEVQRTGYHAEIPLEFSRNRTVYSVEELVGAFGDDPEQAAGCLYSGDLEIWLRRNRKKNLSRIARNIRSKEENERIGVQKFLEQSGLVSPPELRVEQSSIEFKNVHRGEVKPIELYVTARGNGILYGTCRCDPSVEWLIPESRGITGEDCKIKFKVTTGELEPGRSYMTHLHVDCNGGSRKIPVRVSTQKRPPVPEFEPAEQEIVLDNLGQKRVSVTLRNKGEQKFSGQLKSRADWLQIESNNHIELEPNQSRSIRLMIDRGGVKTSTKSNDISGGTGKVSTVVDLLGEEASAAHKLSVFLPARMNYIGLPGGLLVGLIPIFAEVFLVLVMFNFFSHWTKTSRSIGETVRARGLMKDNLLWILGLLPGVIWHISWFLL